MSLGRWLAAFTYLLKVELYFKCSGVAELEVLKACTFSYGPQRNLAVFNNVSLQTPWNILSRRDPNKFISLSALLNTVLISRFHLLKRFWKDGHFFQEFSSLKMKFIIQNRKILQEVYLIMLIIKKHFFVNYLHEANRNKICSNIYVK